MDKRSNSEILCCIVESKQHLALPFFFLMNERSQWDLEELMHPKISHYPNDIINIEEIETAKEPKMMSVLIAFQYDFFSSFIEGFLILICSNSFKIVLIDLRLCSLSLYQVSCLDFLIYSIHLETKLI